MPKKGSVPPLVRRCERCETPYRAWAYEVAQGRRFCSSACYWAAMRIPPWQRRPSEVVLACAQCGEPFRRRRWAIKGGRGRYCSRSCGAKAVQAAQYLEPETRFWAKIDRSGGPDACWPWTARATDGRWGYGVFRWQGGTRLAHRVAWEITNGPVPPETCVLHRCDHPPCCNPAHLWLGDRAANNRDMTAKGRHGTVPADFIAGGVAHRYAPGDNRGTANLGATLDEALVSEARRRAAAGEVTTAIAADLGVGRRALAAAVSGQNWAWLLDPPPVKPGQGFRGSKHVP